MRPSKTHPMELRSQTSPTEEPPGLGIHGGAAGRRSMPTWTPQPAPFGLGTFGDIWVDPFGSPKGGGRSFLASPKELEIPKHQCLTKGWKHEKTRLFYVVLFLFNPYGSTATFEGHWTLLVPIHKESPSSPYLRFGMWMYIGKALGSIDIQPPFGRVGRLDEALREGRLRSAEDPRHHEPRHHPGQQVRSRGALHGMRGGVYLSKS